MLKIALTKYTKRLALAFVILIQVIFFPALAIADDPAPANSGSSTTPTTVDTGSSASTTAPTTTTPAPIVSDPTMTSPPSQPAPTAPTTPSTTTTPAPTTNNTPTPPAQGPTSPTGADSKTYHQNPDGTWSNDYYTWNPTTGQTTPNTPQSYSYNPATGKWDTTEYRYDAPSGKYVPNVVSVTQPPAGASISGSGSGAAGTMSPMVNSAALSAGNGQTSISNSGPSSTNGISLGTTNDAFFNGFFNGTISNTTNSTATSGNASVLQNTIGGSATTGSTLAEADLINMLQSNWNPANGSLNTFIANVGNYTGDLVLDPSVLTTGPNSSNVISGTANNNIKVTDQANGAINNKLNLASMSGDATVSGNTTAGNASTGDANAAGDIVNLMNSSISAGQSFVGVVNINGNLNGDILLPDWLMAGLMAATGPNSTNNVSQTTNNNLNATVNDNQAVANTVNTTANSGSAMVSNNTKAGNATTGAASTNITLLNLTGNQTIGKDALLVFVNVMGKWVGLIMNNPSGTNTASLGTTGPNSNNAINSTTNNNATLNANSKELINNDVTANVRSGNALVSDNTSAGNATSGNAHAGVNIANIVNSNLNLSDWFGILFINVFGSWLGSFGVNTAAGDPPPTTVSTAASSSSTPAPQVFRLTQNSDGKFTPIPVNNNAGSAPVSDSTTTSSNGPGLKAAIIGNQSKPPTTPTLSNASAPFNWAFPAFGVVLGATLLGFERLLAYRQQHHLA